MSYYGVYLLLQSSTIIGRIDSSFVAANSITIVVRQFVMIFTFGIAGATRNNYR